MRFLVRRFGWALLLGCWAAGVIAAESSVQIIEIRPNEVTLRGPDSLQRLLVTGSAEDKALDLTRVASFRSEAPNVLNVDQFGVVRPVGDGTAEVVAEFEGLEARVRVHVTEAEREHAVTFEHDIQPLLSRFGCNQGACHGKARGQNGFQLSLLGFDSNFDYNAIVHEARGRRLFPAAPEQSLFLLKGTAHVPHGGGRRVEPDSAEYKALRRWIENGMPRDPDDAPSVEAVTVWPSERSLEPNADQQLLVTAHYSDGTTTDVTHLAAFQSNESAIVAVDEHGKLTAGPIPGEAAISARFEGFFATCEVSIPLSGDVPDAFYAQLPRSNFIDEHIWVKLQKLGITPSEPAEDTTFIRRAFLDTIGRLPTPDETQTFLEDPDPDKRFQLVDHLLERPEYADHWANKWVDLLRPNPYRVGIKAVYSLDAWIRDAFRRNLPYDEFVEQIITAQGSTWHNGATTIFRDRRDPDELTNMFSQLFLGVRLECAQCHHHPFEVWGQDDFYGFAAYFAKVGRKGRGLSPPISGSEEIMFASDKGTVKHPLTDEVMEPAPLFGEAPAIPEDGDPRAALAEWMTSPDNPYFAQVIVNRVWAEFMGRGVVDPVDDLRATNPPTNGPLLEALAEDFQNNNYDLKHLIRRIMTSHVYGLSSEPNARNVADTRNYSRHYRQRMRAETLLDAVVDVTGVPETFDAAPPGTRASEIWTHRVSSLFLDTFGRPDPNQDPPCERTADSSVTQALHLMNSPALHAKVAHDDGRAAALAQSDATAEEIAEELYLLIYSRFPDIEERAIVDELFERHVDDRRKAVEDLMWALLNSPEFVFKD